MRNIIKLTRHQVAALLELCDDDIDVTIEEVDTHTGSSLLFAAKRAYGEDKYVITRLGEAVKV